MENEQRIWNKSELEQMDEWESINNGNIWFNSKTKITMPSYMEGKPVEWFVQNGYLLSTEMIAKTPCLTMGELTDRLDKGEIGVTLENGTTLKVGDKYRLEYWTNKKDYIEVIDLGDCFNVWAKNSEGKKGAFDGNNDWIPYEDHKEEPKPLEETWTKTMDLRWENEIGDEYALQQKQISNLGNEKWCDVETVILPNKPTEL